MLEDKMTVAREKALDAIILQLGSADIKTQSEGIANFIAYAEMMTGRRRG